MGRYRSHKRSQCQICRVYFHPNPRLGKRQKTCGKQECQKTHRAKYRRQYRRANRKIDQEYQAKRPPDYWKKYRTEHSDYVIRNRAASRLRRQLARQGLQRQLDIVQLIEFPKKLDTFREFATSHRSLLHQCLGTACLERKEVSSAP